jgi:hypothetical protein
LISNETFSTAIVAVAGRRIDAADAQVARFPLKNVSRVRGDLADVLQHHRASAVVSSAACGADLIALEEAERLGLRRRIILPFSPSEFRITSVTDRPGNWGVLYDRLVAITEQTGDLVVLDHPVAAVDGGAYLTATMRIIQEAEMLARLKQTERCTLIAVTIWDGAVRPGNDITNIFRICAMKAGFEDIVILTI